MKKQFMVLTLAVLSLASVGHAAGKDLVTVATYKRMHAQEVALNSNETVTLSCGKQVPLSSLENDVLIEPGGQSQPGLTVQKNGHR